jgi:uncharacterized protein YbjT (DUF2867 family)
MAKKLVTIVTGNSKSGLYCIEELFTRYSDKLNVRGVFRSEDKARPFREKYSNLEIVTGIDAYETKSLIPAFEGAQSALIVTTFDSNRGFADDAFLTANLINSAVENGVKYIVLVGSWTVHADKMAILTSRFKPSEELLVKLEKEKGINWTVLRGGFFMENLIHMFKVSDASEIRLPDFLFPMVATRDIGRSAAACLASDNQEQHYGKYYEMSGPEQLTGDIIAKTFSSVLNREVKFNPLSMDEVRSYLPPYIVQVIFLNFCHIRYLTICLNQIIKKFKRYMNLCQKKVKMPFRLIKM